MLNRWFLTLLAVLPLISAQSQEKKPPVQGCNDPLFHEFDFWIGQWDVRDGSGKLVGNNTITAEQRGCVLIERWQASAGGTGISMNYYDPEARAWRQNWVSPGVILQMSGALRDGEMVMQGPLQNVGAKQAPLLRGVWTQLPDGRLRQHFTLSTDAGKTWTEWFDGYYTRSAAAGK